MSLGVGYGASKAQAKLSVSHFLLPPDMDTELSTSPATWRPACCHSPS